MNWYIVLGVVFLMFIFAVLAIVILWKVWSKFGFNMPKYPKYQNLANGKEGLYVKHTPNEKNPKMTNIYFVPPNRPDLTYIDVVPTDSLPDGPIFMDDEPGVWKHGYFICTQSKDGAQPFIEKIKDIDLYKFDSVLSKLDNAQAEIAVAESERDKAIKGKESLIARDKALSKTSSNQFLPFVPKSRKIDNYSEDYND